MSFHSELQFVLLVVYLGSFYNAVIYQWLKHYQRRKYVIGEGVSLSN